MSGAVIPIGAFRATGGKCDWGHCDNVATSFRFDSDTNMNLPVCDEHAGGELCD